MKSTESDNKILKSIFMFLFFLLLFNSLGLSHLQPFREMALFTDDLTLFFTFPLFLYFIIKERKDNEDYKYLYWIFGLFASAYIISHLVNHNFDKDRTLAVLLLTIIYVLVVIRINWTSNYIRAFSHVASLIIISFFLYWITQDLPTYKYKGIFNNPNNTATFLFLLLFFQVIGMKYSGLIVKIYLLTSILLNSILIYATTSRGIYITVIVILGSWLILKFSKKMFSYLFFVIMIFNFVFVGTYVYLSQTKYAQNLTEWSLNYLKKPFFSGREKIWGDVFNYGMESPLIGHEVGIKPKEYLADFPYDHAHNQYLQIFVESGIIGLGSFLIVLYVIWKTYQKNLDSNMVQWSACFFLGILFYQNMELSLFLDFPSYVYLQWFIIGIGVSKAIEGGVD